MVNIINWPSGGKSSVSKRERATVLAAYDLTQKDAIINLFLRLTDADGAVGVAQWQQAWEYIQAVAGVPPEDRTTPPQPKLVQGDLRSPDSVVQTGDEITVNY